MHFVIAAAIKALKNVWCIGDNFLCENYHALQDLKTDAKMKKVDTPYLYDKYNISAWYMNATSMVRPSIARILNSFIEALNTKSHLPAYVFIIPDKDIIKSIGFCKFRVCEIIKQNITWLHKNIVKPLDRCREDLKDKRIGATAPEHTRLIWVKMLVHPWTNNEHLKKIWTLCQKFNDELEELVNLEKYSHIIKVRTVNELYHFEANGDLTRRGKQEFWSEVNTIIKQFELCKTELKPKSRAYYKAPPMRHPEEQHRNRRKLPTPPGRCRHHHQMKSIVHRLDQEF